jgi:prepilin-type N-terminal cleavage/methylation domain-containing protein/prepilin-type processing-associated H-X9-DG protein
MYKIKESKSKGFTLIELLVVISIIALLMSVLMPALSKAKEQAKAVVCRANLDQWGVIFNMYFMEHDGKVPPGRYGLVSGGDVTKSGWGMWFRATKDYYDNPKMMFCPSATKLAANGAAQPLAAWRLPGADNSSHWAYYYPELQEGSYGTNMWMVAKIGGPFGGPMGPLPEANRIYNASVVDKPFKTPLMGCSSWLHASPEATMDGTTTDAPPPTEEDVLQTAPSQMARFAVNRHNKTINMLFFDGGAYRVGLKTLWQLEWHPNFNTRNMYTPAGGATLALWDVDAPWMKHYKEYLID